MDINNQGAADDQAHFNANVDKAVEYGKWIDANNRCFWCHETGAPAKMLHHVYAKHNYLDLLLHINALMVLAIQEAITSDSDLPW